MNVLILDFETDSADASTTRITEVGAVPFFVEGGKLVPTGTPLSILCYEPEYPPLSQKIQSITGITDELLKSQGVPRKAALEKLLPLVEWADIIIAHKIAFDQTVLYATAKLFDLQIPDRFWLCTLTNFQWPDYLTCHKLGHLAWELGVDVKSKDLHRAVNDCDLLGQTINLFDFDKVLAYAKTPWVYMRADCIEPWKDGGKQTAIAKEFGFSWESVKGTDKPVFPKKWVARFKADNVQKVVDGVRNSASPFRLNQIEGLN